MRHVGVFSAFCWLISVGCTPAESETVSIPETPAESCIQQVELLFCGDLMIHSPQLMAARTVEGYCFDRSFEALRPLVERADVAVVNLETTLAARPPYTGYPLFRSPREVAATLRRVGFDVVCQANNHALDGGAVGVRCTTTTLDSCLLLRTGVFRDSIDWRRNRIVYLRHDGIRLALLNYTYGTNGMPVPRGMRINRIDTVQMASDLAAVDPAVDAKIVCMHWGNEYERQPNREQRRLTAFLRRQGVDVIIGHHPHVVQPFEVDSSGVVFYSLGNLLSNQRKRYSDGGLLARVVVEKRSDGRLHYKAEAIPVWVDKQNGYRILPLVDFDSLQGNPCADRFLSDTYQLLLRGV